jgi:hypothetical protein
MTRDYPKLYPKNDLKIILFNNNINNGSLCGDLENEKIGSTITGCSRSRNKHD